MTKEMIKVTSAKMRAYPTENLKDICGKDKPCYCKEYVDCAYAELLTRKDEPVDGMTVEQRVRWTAELERREALKSTEIQKLSVSVLRLTDKLESSYTEQAELKAKHSVQYGQALDMFDALKKDYLDLLHYVKELEA